MLILAAVGSWEEACHRSWEASEVGLTFGCFPCKVHQAMKTLASIAELPNKPAVYALYGGRGRGLYVAYVGAAEALKRRIIQHLVSRDSSVATGTSAVGINPDHVTEVRWWEHPAFKERHVLEAAELVAYEVLDPALRSRGKIRQQAKQVYAQEAFRRDMRALFTGDPAGRLRLLTLQDVIERLAELEERLRAVERKLGGT